MSRLLFACAAATLGLLPPLRVCPSARGITITKATLSKNAPRRRYVLTVVGCLFILDCSFNFLFTFLNFPAKPFFCLQPWGEQSWSERPRFNYKRRRVSSFLNFFKIFC